MVDIVLCDDDKIFISRLSDTVNKYLVSKSDSIDYRIHTFFSPTEILEYAAHSHPNIVFLDIDMPLMSGFEVAEALRARFSDIIIIFVSAYEKFVYESFNYTPIYFMRKEYVAMELKKVLSTALSKFFEDSRAEIFETADGPITLRVKDIVYIESVKNYYVVSCKSGKQYTCRGTLLSVEQRLLDCDFYRINKSCLINLQNIMSMGKKHEITVCPNTLMVVSSKKWQDFNAKYMEFLRRRVSFNAVDDN